MSLSATVRRTLAAQAHALKPSATLTAERLSEVAVAHVRQAFAVRPLIKVRIQAEDRAECLAAARDLAERVPCELVQVVGRVALLYQEVDSQ